MTVFGLYFYPHEVVFAIGAGITFIGAVLLMWVMWKDGNI